ncbi:MAG: rRNA maturation RNAse YbeY, partial [Acidimicrobiales bacterium]|nr:rRNA maturation RNAse YbeY [Acidimicrobiales bacterium]
MAGSPTVIVDDERAYPVDTADCRALVADVLDHEGMGGSDLEVHVHLVDAESMAALNAEHMGGEGPTDVLSFPLEDPQDLASATIERAGVPFLLG